YLNGDSMEQFDIEIEKEDRSKWGVNELHPEFLGIASLNPMAMHDSSTRQQMLGSHAGQAQRIKGATVRRLLSGSEREFGEYSFKITMPVDGTILKIIPRY